MSVVNISLPSNFIREVEKYKKITGENRSEFFKNAAKLYFKKIDENLVFERKKKAIRELMKIGEEIRKEGVFEGVDVVEEIRKMRKERTDELLRRIK